MASQGIDSTRSDGEYFYYGYAPEHRIGIDTSLRNLEEYNFVQRDGLEYMNLGNLGLAHRPLFLKTADDIGFRHGMDQFALYNYSRDSIKYYHLNGPYVELSYMIGLSNESLFRGRHSQRLSRTFDYGLEFQRINSNGQLASQMTLNNGFWFYSRYQSVNQRYELTGNIIYNRSEADENGGVTSNIYDTSATFISRSIIDVTLNNSKNDYRNTTFAVTNKWNLGYHLPKRVNDTTTIDEFHPQFSLEYDLSLGKRNHQFFDANPDSGFYGLFYTTEDSIQHRLRYSDVQQSVTFKSMGHVKRKGKKAWINNVASASIVHNNIELKQRGYERTFNNLSVRFITRSNQAIPKKLSYRFAAGYTLTGYNQNDLELAAGMAYDFGKIGWLSLQARQLVNQAAWIAHRYESFDLKWLNSDFKKIRTFDFTARYELRSQRLALEFKYHRIDNHIYWDTAGLPNQLPSGINGVRVGLQKDFRFKNLHWTNFLLFQSYNNDGDVVRIPTFWSKHSLYYQGRIFKGVMLASFGFDVRVSTDYFADRYNAITGQFHLQNDLEMTYYPVVDVFLNAKVSSVRVSLKVNNVNQGLFRRGYYGAYLYPTDLRSFIVGVHWRFFD